MLLTKIFHLHQSVTEAREYLRDFGTWNSSDHEVNCTLIDAGNVGRFEFNTPLGHRVSADIEEIPGEETNRILFHSVHGNVELAGMVEFFPIRENLTEIVLTLEYDPVSPLHKALGTVTAAVDLFLNRQLARLVQPRATHGLSGGFA